jgi:hypothetical protein
VYVKYTTRLSKVEVIAESLRSGMVYRLARSM